MTMDDDFGDAGDEMNAELNAELDRAAGPQGDKVLDAYAQGVDARAVARLVSDMRATTDAVLRKAKWEGFTLTASVATVRGVRKLLAK